MAKKIKCGCSKMADLKFTKQKPGAQRRMPPRPYIGCPACGPQFSTPKACHERLLRDAVEVDDNPPGDAVTDNPPTLPDNPPPVKKSGFFEGWSPL